jgi:probable F420-dependent oxidoreductase
MPHPRKFRFAAQLSRAPGGTARSWAEQAKKAEDLGYSTLLVPDHFGDQLAPVPALMAAADATERLRIGSLVFDNDYRHPLVLAKEAATLDLLSDGRFDFGIGAGWMIRDYEQSGIPYDPAGTRIERMAEAVTIFKKFFAGGEFSFEGKHFNIQGLEGTPLPVQKPHPPFVIGGGGRKMLELAAREADTINVNFNLREGRPGNSTAQTGLAAVTDEKLRWIREAAGDRFEAIELGVWILRASVTDDRDVVAQAFAPRTGIEPKDLLEVPHFMIGTIDQIVEDLQKRRERYGISHVVVPGDAADDLAPVVERLAGK